MSALPRIPRCSLCLADPPKTYWIATDLDNLITSHNLKFTGSLSSMAIGEAELDPEKLVKYVNGDLDYLPYIRNPTQDVRFIGPYQLTATATTPLRSCLRR
jgi:hypothetical protein